MALYRLATGGVIRGGAFIPDDDSLQAWNVYQDWLGAGNTPDPAATPVLADEQTNARQRIEEKAEELRLAIVPQGGGRAMLERLRLEEAVLADADVMITAGEYPLLEAEVPITGVDVAAVATAVLNEKSAMVTWFSQVEAVRVATLDAIDNAADVAAVATAESAASWPSPPA